MEPPALASVRCPPEWLILFVVCAWPCWSAKTWAEGVIDDRCRQPPHQRREKDASVVIGGTGYDLPMRKGTVGPDVVDVSTLYQDTGRFTYDPGFTSTASCKSKITFIDFDKGIVLLSRVSDRTTRRAQHLS